MVRLAGDVPPAIGYVGIRGRPYYVDGHIEQVRETVGNLAPVETIFIVAHVPDTKDPVFDRPVLTEYLG